MSTIGSFLRGLFTRHVGTKFLSLLLAALIYVFTEQSLSGARTLRDVSINFELDAELADEFVLLGSEIELGDIKIHGKIVDVDRAASRLTQFSNLLSVPVNRAFIEANGAQRYIRIDKRFCETQSIFGDKIELDSEPAGNPRIYIDRLRMDVRLTPVLRAGQEESLLLGVDHPYQTTTGEASLTISFLPDVVTISGPASAFQSEIIERGQLPILIPDLAGELGRRKPAVGKVSWSIKEILWEEAGVEPDDLARIRIVEPRNESIADLARDLRIEFEVERRWKVGQLKELEIDHVTPRGMPDPAEGFLYRGEEDVKEFDSQWLHTGKCKGFWVSAPFDVWENEEELAQLTLVLDFRNRQEERDADGEVTKIVVPLRLGVKDPGRAGLELLGKVRIVNVKNEASTTPSLRWDRKSG